MYSIAKSIIWNRNVQLGFVYLTKEKYMPASMPIPNVHLFIFPSKLMLLAKDVKPIIAPSTYA